MALSRILSPIKLNGNEFKFARKSIGVSSSEMAKLLQATPETYSRWENNHQGAGEQSEKQFRMVVAHKLKDKAPAIDFEIFDLVTMKIVPFRPINEEPINLELVMLKEAKQKKKTWDRSETGIAA